MTAPRKPSPPAGTAASGKALWTAVLAEWELDSHELALLREAVRTVDQLDRFAAIVKREGDVIESPQGLKVHPAAVEARQARIALARILAALRLPDGLEGDESQGRRSQRRSGVRGIYGIKGGKSA